VPCQLTKAVPPFTGRHETSVAPRRGEANVVKKQLRANAWRAMLMKKSWVRTPFLVLGSGEPVNTLPLRNVSVRASYSPSSTGKSQTYPVAASKRGVCGHAVALRLRHYATSRKIVGSKPHVNEFFFNFGRTRPLGFTQPLT
jgi:hypothetical protein